jgi:flagellar hook-associated protein 1 FlgK
VVSAATTNAGTATVTASIASAGALVASDYRLAFDGTDYSLTRLSDGTTQSFATLPQTVDGVTIDLAGAPAAGDRFLIKPVHQAASSITVALGDPAGIAAAAPLASSASTANVGSATIGPASASATYPASPLGGPVTLTYAAGTATLSGFPATQPVTVTVGATSTTYAAGVPVPYTAGATFSFGGASFTLSGSPANGDMFSIAPNANGGGDNRNAQALAGLADRTLMGNGTATFASAYGQVVAAVGNAAQQADIEHQAQAALLDQTHAAQQALSGVNLDEEAANLQRYQQAYQASSKALAIAGSLFDSILDIMR